MNASFADPLGILQWPSVRDVCDQLHISQPYVHQLIVRGRLQIVRTRVGILVNPESVSHFAATRKPRVRVV
jgi:excisionase family DNA binding protein